jgi:predicted HAD superfamily Cof-like phosphohydrolase
MSTNWVQDIADMHQKYGVNPVVRNFDKDKLEAFLKFRIDFLQEELDEMRNAVANRQASALDTANASDDVVDALIDLCVVAIGTLDAFDVNAYEAWDRVHKANMNKEVGVKASRPNPLGLPDLIKPEGWVAPTHKDNLGLVTKALS